MAPAALNLKCWSNISSNSPESYSLTKRREPYLPVGITNRLGTKSIVPDSLQRYRDPRGTRWWILCCWPFFLMAVLPCNLIASTTAAEEGIDWKKEKEFWSFQPPQRQARPAVANPRWARQPIDFFILSRLDGQGVSPSLEADKRTLVRRLTFDLTGLPPTKAEVDSFLADRRADAYERLVERLLGSSRFGERMASLWLPLARYAEDQAHQVGDDTKFFYPNAWKYREWVIDSFNEDLSYDTFLKMQLAADCLEGTNSRHLAGLGFLGLGPKYYNRGRLDVMADEWEDRVDTVSRTMLGLTVACARCHDHKYEPITSRDYYAMAGVFASTRMVNRRPDGSSEKNEAQSTNMTGQTMHVVLDADSPEDVPIFIRGNVDRKGEVAKRSFLQVLSEDKPRLFNHGSGRADLAAAITERSNPLTARVMVNRVWGQFFGHPLVATPSNFGHSGQRPTHPELLDDLAVRFMEDGWSVKSLVRELVLSATYRQSSLAGQSATDPANEMLSHMNRRRLSVEQWRDAILYVTGELDFAGGKSLELDNPTNNHRTVYARISRLKLNDLLMQMDYPDANVHAEKRTATTTAMQKLFVLNSAWMMNRARALAARLQKESPGDDAGQVVQLYQWLYNREPSREESALAKTFVARPQSGDMPRWEQYCQLLLAANEMLYVD
jgi:hypothetical protein